MPQEFAPGHAEKNHRPHGQGQKILIRNLGAFFAAPGRKKPGYPLQVLSPPSAGLRAFRFYPGCMGEQQFCLQNCDQPLAHGRQTVLRYQHGASPTACLYGLKANRDQPGMHGRQTVLRYQHGASPTACLYGLKAELRPAPCAEKTTDPTDRHGKTPTLNHFVCPCPSLSVFVSVVSGSRLCQSSSAWSVVPVFARGHSKSL
jgi:hypothetical protein